MIRTRGLSAWAAEAQDRQTLLAGSSPQVIWICSGVPSADLDSDRPPAALNIPDKPTPVTNVRLDIRPGADRSPAAPHNFGIRLFATDALDAIEYGQAMINLLQAGGRFKTARRESTPTAIQGCVRPVRCHQIDTLPMRTAHQRRFGAEPILRFQFQSHREPWGRPSRITLYQTPRRRSANPCRHWENCMESFSRLSRWPRAKSSPTKDSFAGQ